MITGIEEIDKCIEHDKNNIIISLAGRPGMGQSELAIDIISCYCEEEKRVVYFSTQKYKEDILYAIDEIYDCPSIDDYRIRIEDEVFTIEEIVDECKDECSTSLVIIDCFEDIESNSGYVTDKQKELAVMQGLREISDMHDCPVLLLTKVDRSLEYQDSRDRRPTEDFINKTVCLYSDVVMTLYREGYYSEEIHILGDKQKIEIELIKNRGGRGYNRFSFGWFVGCGIDWEEKPDALF